MLVPGLTLDDDRLGRLGQMLRPYTCIERVELLPFHKLGEYKWRELGEAYTLGGTLPPTPEEEEKARHILQEYGLPVR